MLITIPTRGRANWKNQVTVRNFIAMKSKREFVLCIPDTPKLEGMSYRNNSIQELKNRETNFSVAYVPSTHDGISYTRKWILTNLAEQRGERYVLMLDDDMDFCYRPDMSKDDLETIKDPERFEAMFQMLEGWLAEGFVHIGLAARQGSNHVSEPYREATRMMNAYAYDTHALRMLGVELGRIPVMEDFDLTLQLLRKGYPNRVSYQYVWNQRGSGAEGGCSSYRTSEMQMNAAKELQRLHPAYVSVVMKSTGTVWKDMEERGDVIVQWQKAYEEGKDVCNRSDQHT
jgi:hypothetical protein